MEEELLIDENEAFNDSQPERPQFLTVLCILSWIWNGLVVLFGLIMALAVGAIFSVFESGDFPMDPDQKVQIDAFLGLGQGLAAGVFLLFAVIAGITIASAWLMWKQKRVGFFIYTALHGILAVLYFVGDSLFAGVLCAAFIGMYAANLKHMR
ncbi:MAG: hypothetical protein ACFB10_24710 [Salibacteraceae bacterium]